MILSKERVEEWFEIAKRDDACNHFVPSDLRQMLGCCLALYEEREKLRKALKPFAFEADRYDPDEGDGLHRAWDSLFLIKQLRAARTALKETFPKEKG